MSDSGSIISALVIALVAAGWDIRTRRIPNMLVLMGAVAGLFYHAFSGAGILHALEGLGVGLAIMLPLYLLRAMGAGDVKLVAMLGTWLGPSGVALAALFSYVAGGVLALAITFRKRAFGQLFANLRLMVTGSVIRLASGRVPTVDKPATVGKIPFGVAIALGTLAYVILKQTGHLTIG